MTIFKLMFPGSPSKEWIPVKLDDPTGTEPIPRELADKRIF